MISPINPGAEDISRAAALLRAGKLVAFPTETVYGLGASALESAAVRRIFEVKGRPANSPLIVHVDSVERVLDVVREWPAEAAVLAEKFWPGPLTLVLPKHARVPDEVTAGLDTVGVRIPAHSIALALLRAAGIPVAAPSANRFTQLSPTTAQHVREALGDAVDFILDGGACSVGIESTVLSLATGVPVLLRPGMISREQLEAVIGAIQTGGRPEDASAHNSPGQHPRHYQPRTRLVIATRDNLPPGNGAFVEMPRNAADYAASLYDTLHDMDAQHLDWIALHPVPETPEWDGVRDRLRRASAR